ncbi:uncharacterized protein EV154DRAFT_564793 [Mucor mucedo]|uniref:uncharacterized protein n=1 Tax=Mucor mucedo TaxID=29922 RepID=UPI00221EB14F|nr:uncharacterized protein EV154DRAFT_564793 [Mucor mucedo]KAI7890013.1 hypothetical protein EV154DRAFT_564793 [Mucor mucedo]
MQEFISSYCVCQVPAEDREKHILNKHVSEILENRLKPVFKRQTQIHPVLSHQPEPRYRAAYEYDLHENQEWKTGNTLDILLWIAIDLEKNLHLIIPPVLIVLDDVDIEYKEYGVKMVHGIVKKLDSNHIAKFGLDNVVFESLFKCLYRLSQDRDIEILKLAYPCILDLIGSIKNERTRSGFYERVLTDGIMTGYQHAGQKIKFLPILLQPIATIYDAIGAIGVQYLKAIIPILCDSMSMISSNNEIIQGINQLAAESLVTVIKKCWPRIPAYEGAIMQALAKSWSYNLTNKDTKMCGTLKQLYKVFEAACQGQEIADKEALIAYNPSVFEPLFL